MAQILTISPWLSLPQINGVPFTVVPCLLPSSQTNNLSPAQRTSRFPQSPVHDTQQTSRGKSDRLHRTPAKFTAMALDGYGLRDLVLTRPTITASYLVPVRRVAALLHASFRPRLTTTSLRFANPSPPSVWVEDFHLQAAEHARHTQKKRSQ